MNAVRDEGNRIDQTAFDRISQLFAAKAARRAALTTAAAAAAVAVMPDAEAKPGKGKPGASKKKGKKPKQEEKTMFLFLQTARGGTLVDNGDGTFDLVLEGHHGGTIFFSDRPQRVFGVSPTDDFLDALGFPADNPPNAALLVNAGDVEDAAIVELFDPAYDETTGRLTYKVKILEGYDESGLEHIANQVTDSELPAAFDQASLFIDDCDDWSRCCALKWDPYGDHYLDCHPIPAGIQTGRCWHWGALVNAGCGECWDGELDRISAACTQAYGSDYTRIGL